MRKKRNADLPYDVQPVLEQKVIVAVDATLRRKGAAQPACEWAGLGTGPIRQSSLLILCDGGATGEVTRRGTDALPESSRSGEQRDRRRTVQRPAGSARTRRGRARVRLLVRGAQATGLQLKGGGTALRAGHGQRRHVDGLAGVKKGGAGRASKAFSN